MKDTPTESWEKEWDESPVAKRIVSTELFAINHGYPEWTGETITDFFRTKLDLAFKAGEEKVRAERRGFWVTCFEGNGLAGCAHWSPEECVCPCHADLSDK